MGIWGSDHSGPSPPPTVQLSNHTDAVGSGRTFITLWISHNYYRLKNNQIDTEMCSDCFYDLNDGNNREGSVNRDFWLAFNRAVSGMSSRNGYGTCNVKLSWVCNVPGND